MTRSEVLEYVTTAILAKPRDHPIRVAIDGVDAAGKTTLADQLVGHSVHFGSREAVEDRYRRRYIPGNSFIAILLVYLMLFGWLSGSML